MRGRPELMFLVGAIVPCASCFGLRPVRVPQQRCVRQPPQRRSPCGSVPAGPRRGPRMLRMCGPEGDPLSRVGELSFVFEQDAKTLGRSAVESDVFSDRRGAGQIALSPLQSPELATQTVIRFHARAQATMASLCERASAPADASSTADIAHRLRSLLEQERAKRAEISAHAHVLFESSPFSGVGTLPSGPAPPAPNDIVDAAELGRVLEACVAWQRLKHAEEQGVLMPLLAMACLKAHAQLSGGAVLDAKTAAQLMTLNAWLASRAALALTLCTPSGDRWCGSSAVKIADDPNGNLLFCKSTSGMLRAELLEVSRLSAAMRRGLGEGPGQPRSVFAVGVGREMGEALRRLGLLIAMRRCVYVALLHPGRQALQHPCVPVIADQVRKARARTRSRSARTHALALHARMRTQSESARGSECLCVCA